MQPSVDDLDRLCQLFRDSDFDELVLHTEGFHVELRRAGMVPVSSLPKTNLDQPFTPPSAPVSPATTPEHPSEQSLTPQPTAAVTHCDTRVAIKAGVSGVFYSAASPTSDPFVEVGSHVRAGDTLGLIEVMKLFTSVTAEIDGVIDTVLVENGTAVQEGDVLFRIRSGG